MAGRRVADAPRGRRRRRRRSRRFVLAAVAVPLVVTAIGVGRAGQWSVFLDGLAPTGEQVTTATGERPALPLPVGTPSASTAGSDDGSGGTRTAVAATTATPSPTPSTGSPTSTSTTTPAPTRRPARREPVGVTAPEQTFVGLAYAGHSSAQRLDLYLPGRTGRAVPLVIDIHGGAFSGGGRSQDRDRIDVLVARGYAVASIDYRLSGEAPFPAGARDVKAAVRWLRAAAPRYGIDPARFAAWGDSAGGYFAALLGATSGRSTALDDPGLGNAKVSSSVQAVVDFYGPVDFLTMDRQAVAPGGCPGSPQAHDEAGSPESLWLGSAVQSMPARAREASPLTYLTGRGTPPPFLVAHGTADCQVPQGQTLQLVAALKARRVPTEVHLLDGVGHGAPEFEERLQTTVLTFLDRTLGRGA
jgi:acetyl esterase/lipase